MTFGNLTRLSLVELNANKLTHFPDSIGLLRCHTFAANGNALLAVAPSFGGMGATLRRLSLCDNRLEALPTEVGDLTRLERLRVMGNRLHSLPGALCKCSALRELWVGQNPTMTALPSAFHNLTSLVNLIADGNPSMAYPNAEVLLRGAKAVLEWSKVGKEPPTQPS